MEAKQNSKQKSGQFRGRPRTRTHSERQSGIRRRPQERDVCGTAPGHFLDIVEPLSMVRHTSVLFPPTISHPYDHDDIHVGVIPLPLEIKRPARRL